MVYGLWSIDDGQRIFTARVKHRDAYLLGEGNGLPVALYIHHPRP